ncbi:MAG: hypothetical protein Greene07147_196 [Parcubacteria group bacterium Greene0714_7]|nr:MAG: hypothetical protein Greene07147_196 [Parcubacteria group bacterium Greene0714_7]
MKDFKKGGGFGGGRSGGGFKKPSFGRGAPQGGGSFRGGPKRDFSAPLEMHQATCVDCGKMCEVPFRPNGKKPVFCRDCFASKREDSSRSFSHAPSNARPAFRSNSSEGGERQGNDLKNQVELLHSKVDKLTRMIEALGATPSEDKTVRPSGKALVKPSVRKASPKVSKK